MKEQALTRETNRRDVLRLSGMGVLGAVAAGVLASPTARGAEGDINISADIRIPYASWIHGHSMQIEYPDRIASQWRAGFSFTIEGNPGSSNWLHFAIPTPVIINDVRLRVDSVMLCFKTGSVDSIVRDVHIYDGDTVLAVHDGINLAMENRFVRLAVPDRPFVWLALGISIGVSFGVEMMDHHMEFVAAGCDFSV